jgi:hypothetical protein
MYFSFLNTLKTCTKILENLEALNLFLEMSDDDYFYFVNRKESCIKNEDLRCFLLLNSFSISELVIKTNDDIKNINSFIPDTLEKLEVDLSKHDSLWNEYLSDRKHKDTKEMSKDISTISTVCKKWLKYLQDEEDRGTESSYSDYSGDSTETSDDDEEDERRTNSSS